MLQLLPFHFIYALMTVSEPVALLALREAFQFKPKGARKCRKKAGTELSSDDRLGFTNMYVGCYWRKGAKNAGEMTPKCQYQTQNKYRFLWSIASFSLHGYSISFTTTLRPVISYAKTIPITSSYWHPSRIGYAFSGAFRWILSWPMPCLLSCRANYEPSRNRYNIGFYKLAIMGHCSKWISPGIFMRYLVNVATQSWRIAGTVASPTM